jgi:MoaA/NifB/PqqE/SkfB family radical SAM enzyme
MERQVYRDVILNRLKRLDIEWFLHKAYVYVFLMIEKHLGTGFAPAPLACGLVVTENCNMRCPMCVLPQRYLNNPNNCDTQTWKRVIDELHELGMGGIAISGGEPTLRQDISDLLDHARGNNTVVTLNSNMTALGAGRIEKLMRAAPDNISVSIDSGNEEINDCLRGGKDVLRRVMEGIRALDQARKAHGVKTTISVVATLSDLNLEDLDVLFAKAKESGADRISFLPLHDIKDGRTYVVTQPKARPDLYDVLAELSAKHNLPLENSRRYLKGFYNVMSGGLPKERCNVGYTHLIIGADLTIYRCTPFMNMGMPILRWDPTQTRLKDLWNSPVWRKDRLAALECKQCYWNCHAEINGLIPM